MSQMLAKLTAVILIVLTVVVHQTLLHSQEESVAAPREFDVTNNVDKDEQRESPLHVEPQQPEQLFDAVVLMLELARPSLARQYLDKFLKLEPDDATILELREKHGPAVFRKLANISELQPASIRLLERTEGAIRRRADDPSRIDALVSKLQGPPPERDLAILQLKNAGASAVPRLLTHLSAAPADSDQRDHLVFALTQLGPQIVPPLVAALDSPNENLRSSVIEVLGRLDSQKSVPYLWYPAFADSQPTGVQLAAREALERILHVDAQRIDRVSSYGAAHQLEEIALTHFRREYPWETDDDGRVSYWTWHSEGNQVVLVKVPPEAASLGTGTRLARQALELASDRREVQALYLGLALASDAYQAGWERPLPTGPGTAHDAALITGSETISGVLTLALEHEHSASMIAALKVLQQAGSHQHLIDQKGRQSPILAALNFPDRRVQFAAANTVLQLEPRRPFRGAHRVVEILERALHDDGQTKGVVIDANQQRAHRLADALSELGYAAILAPTGRDGFHQAARRMDVDLVVLHCNAIRWELSQTIANLRADVRTVDIPIAIYGPVELRGRIDDLVRRHAHVTFVAETTSADVFGRQVRSLLRGTDTPPFTPSQRSQIRAMAAHWFANIAVENRTDIFKIAHTEDSLFYAVQDEQTALNALTALGAIPSRFAQEHLQNVAVNGETDTSLRQSAAIQLVAHIQQFGLLLSQEQVWRIHHSWRTAPRPELSTALASVIGSLKPDAQLVGRRLQQSLSANSDASDGPQRLAQRNPGQ